MPLTFVQLADTAPRTIESQKNQKIGRDHAKSPSTELAMRNHALRPDVQEVVAAIRQDASSHQ